MKISDDVRDEVSDLPAGETWRFDHQFCEAGEDTRRRLYITKPASGGKLLAYCHNCQQGTVIEQDSFRKSSRPPMKPLSGSFNLPEVELRADKWPSEMKNWLSKNGLPIVSSQWTGFTGIGYHPHTHSIYLPMYEEIAIHGDTFDTPRVKGYQLRALSNAERRGPKYVTAMVDEDEVMSSLLTRWWGSHLPMQVGVVVEDLLSGWRIIQAMSSNVSVLVNYGTKIDLSTLASLKAERYVVWLDNDNAHVKSQAKKMAKTLELIHGNPCRVEKRYADPKKLPLASIQEALNGHG